MTVLLDDNIPRKQMRRSLTRRLQYLRNWEAFNAVWISCALPAFAHWAYAGDQGWELVLGTTTLLGFLLAQGALYRHLKLREIAGLPLPSWVESGFRGLQRASLVLLAALPWWLGWAVGTGGVTTGAAVGAGAAYVTAAGEYVNYYVVQLMHDTPNDLAYLWRYRRLRWPSLRKELSASKRRRC